MTAIIAMPAVMTMAVSCRPASFKGSSQPGPRGGSDNGLPSNSPWPQNPGGTPNPDLPPTVPGPTTSLEIVYDSHESRDNGRWTGIYTYSLQRNGAAPAQILAYNSGATGSATVPGICQCGVRNDFDLVISAGNLTQNLTAWHQETIAAHTKPTSASDVTDFIDGKNVNRTGYPPAPSTVYFGGFDHIFLGSAWCAGTPFACDTRKWNNRDDNMIVFSCKISACPNGGAGTELHFIGEDN